MIETIKINSLYDLPVKVPLVDVRTPAEFEHGHIPGAFNIPLFTNEERVQLGTTYKQLGKDAAVMLGFDLTGSKWSAFIKQALEIAPGKKIAVHCWRGGMRSGAMAWALDFYGFKVSVIQGGYKAFRRAAHACFERPYDLKVIGGMTGSGKTGLLKTLASEGEQVIDLEELAGHQGSSYGSMDRLKQPTQEQFENNLASNIAKFDAYKTIWVEDESINIGRLQVPKSFWLQLQNNELIDLQIPRNERVEFLARSYGILNKDFLVEATMRIRKRLGPEQTRSAIAAINENRMEDFISQVLVYYDKTYLACLAKRNNGKIQIVESHTTDAMTNAAAVKSALRNNSTSVLQHDQQST